MPLRVTGGVDTHLDVNRREEQAAEALGALGQNS
jgi:hypothetical protein